MSTDKRSMASRGLAVFITIMMMFTLVTIIPGIKTDPSYAAGETAKVTASALNVRSGAGTSYKKLGTIKKGYTFKVTGSAKDKSGVKWYTLSYKSKKGYVSSKYVNIIKSSVKKKGTVTVSNLNVRSGAGTNYRTLGTIKKGNYFYITGTYKDKKGASWYRFKYKGGYGYVASKYIKTTTVSSPTPSKPVTPSKTTYSIGKVTSDGLNVRAGAGTSYAKRGTLDKGDRFTITGTYLDKSKKKWYRLTYGGKTSYVSASYVSVTKSTVKAPDPAPAKKPAPDKKPSGTSFRIGTVATGGSSLNVRTGAGTNYAKLTSLPDGSSFTITGEAKDRNGKTWYRYKYSSSKNGYVCSDYVRTKKVSSSSSFEAKLDAEGFPESYRPGLRAMHAAHPNWKFEAVKVGSWNTALKAETRNMGTNLVSPGSPAKYRNPASYRNGHWTRFDGNWYSADKRVVAHYMDPRNFLSDTKVFQFMTHRYDASTQSPSTVAAVVKGTFMQSRKPGGGYSSYATLINAAGKASKVNPNVLAAMIIQEQGTKGTSPLISGNYPGYRGYYNFFNVGAYTTASRNKIAQGLWYASRTDSSQSRPWNSVYKSIKGGAQFYYSSYVSKRQDTYYTKKFNVKNGSSRIGTHQYMTNVSGAASEGSLLRKAFNGHSNYAATFEIPVYTYMPSSPCPLP